MNNLRLIKSVIIILLVAGLAYAQSKELSVSSTVSSTKVGLEDLLYFTINVKGTDLSGVPEPRLPAIEGFKVLGSSRSSSRHVTFSGNQSQVQLSYNYTFSLKPTKKGKFQIPSVTIEHKGVKYSTKPLSIDVVEGSIQPARRRSGSIIDDFFDDDPFDRSPFTRRRQKEITDEVFIEIVPASSEVYVGEQVVLNTYLYAADVNIRGMSETGSSASLDGFWSEEIEVNPNATRTLTKRDNRVYSRFTLKSQVLFPTRPGAFKLDPLTLEMSVQSSGFGFTVPQRITRKSNSVRIKVKPLPSENVPEKFAGAVGRYAVRATLDKVETEVGKAVNLSIKYSGIGNLKDLPQPDLSGYENDFNIYPPEIEKNTALSDRGWGGSKEWKFILVPKYAGKVKLGPFSLSYFDSTRNTYETISTSTLELEVKKGDGTPLESVTQQTVDTTMADINYIREIEGKVTDESATIFSRLYIWLLIAIPFLLNTGLFAFNVYQSKRKTKSAEYRCKHAYSNALKIVKKSSRLSSNEEKDKFFDYIIKAIATFFADKWNVSSGGITIEQIRKRMQNLDSELTEEVIELLEDCEYHRFAFTGKVDDEKMKEFVSLTKQLLTKLEKEFGKCKKG